MCGSTPTALFKNWHPATILVVSYYMVVVLSGLGLEEKLSDPSGKKFTISVVPQTEFLNYKLIYNLN